MLKFIKLFFLPNEALSLIPFMNTKGYHNKSISYSIYHIFIIEDIVVHEMIEEDNQVFLETTTKIE